MSLGTEDPAQDGTLASTMTHIPLRYLVNPVPVTPVHVNEPGSLRSSEPQAKLAGERMAVGAGDGLGIATDDTVKVRKMLLTTSGGWWQGLLKKRYG